MRHLKGNLMASVDLETTGTDPKVHEIIQIGIVILDDQLCPTDKVFSYNIRPNFPELADPSALIVHGLTEEDLMDGLDSERAIEMLLEWTETLDMPIGGRLVPLAHNHLFENGFLQAWLGKAVYSQVFGYLPRDGMILALAINDKAALAGEPLPFSSVSLPSLCSQFGIVNEKAHDALADAMAEAQVYKTLLENY
jgi:DNA polymerase-3 subunit epsilon